jgi:hypothetical protein
VIYWSWQKGAYVYITLPSIFQAPSTSGTSGSGTSNEENRKRKRERDTDADSLEDPIDSIEKSAKVERVKDCDEMKVAKG